MEQHNKLYLTSDESILFDENYRYIISVIETSHSSKKGTTITMLDNFSKFCKELEFDESILLSILGKKLSCKSGIDKYTKYYYLQGEFSHSQIKQILYEFIQKYLLCNMCDKPEVRLTYKQKQDRIQQKCNACGNKYYLEDENEIIHI